MWILWLNRCLLLLLLQHLVSLSSANSQPNIVFILADDLGWNHVSWHNSSVISPRMQELVDNGVNLEQSYVQPVCTPSRSALLTGMYPFHLGRQSGIVKPQEPTGVTLNYTFFPQDLQGLGYSTHAIGKWHVGFCNVSYTPLRRGFDTFYGFYCGSGDYYDHTRGGNDGHPYFDFRDQERVAEEVAGTYTTNLMTNRAIEIILDQVGRTKPMFLYLPYQNVHGPYEAPDEYFDLYPSVSHTDTRYTLASVTAMDHSIGMVVDALKVAGIYNNTIIIFSSDNGGTKHIKESNIPLRGYKSSVWEGGTRGAAFMHSPLLENTPRVYNGLLHITDWYNTILAAAGATELPDNDGYNQWDVLRTGFGNPPREDFIYNIDETKETLKGAIRVGDYKYITGETKTSMTMGETQNTSYNGPWLFNIAEDPNEDHNLASEKPGLALELEALLMAELPGLVPADKLPQTHDGIPTDGAWGPGWCEAH